MTDPTALATALATAAADEGLRLTPDDITYIADEVAAGLDTTDHPDELMLVVDHALTCCGVDVDLAVAERIATHLIRSI